MTSLPLRRGLLLPDVVSEGRDAVAASLLLLTLPAQPVIVIIVVIIAIHTAINIIIIIISSSPTLPAQPVIIIIPIIVTPHPLHTARPSRPPSRCQSTRARPRGCMTGLITIIKY